MKTVEFRDPDGSYVLAVPLDEERCRILASNVLPVGQIAYKDPDLTWAEASQELGGFTRMPPDDLSPTEYEWVEEDVFLDEEEESGEASFTRTSDDRLSFLERVPDRTSSSRTPAPGALDPREMLGRLIAHYIRVHPGFTAADLAQSGCHCPGFRLGGERSAFRLHVLVGLTMAAKEYDDLETLVEAFQKRARPGGLTP